MITEAITGLLTFDSLSLVYLVVQNQENVYANFYKVWIIEFLISDHSDLNVCDV